MPTRSIDSFVELLKGIQNDGKTSVFKQYAQQQVDSLLLFFERIVHWRFWTIVADGVGARSHVESDMESDLVGFT